MSRKTKMNSITNPELIAQINPVNAELISDFSDYLRSIKRSKSTIDVYKNDLHIAFVWGLQFNDNKPFPEWTKREIVRFQTWLVSVNGNSPARVRRLKATLSSLSNYIETVLDDTYRGFRNIIHKVESPVLQPVREKTVLSERQLDILLKRLIVERGDEEKACMLALGMCSGRRKAELVRFKVNYFDDTNLVYGSLYKTPERIKTKGRGDGKFLHCYTLAHKFRPYFEAWMKRRERDGIESEWLFPSHTDPSEPLGTGTLDSWAATFSRMLGVDFYWHSLRHHFTTQLLRAGIPDTVVANIIGWDSLDMVTIYNDIPIDEQIGKYFDEHGIKAPEAASLSDL